MISNTHRKRIVRFVLIFAGIFLYNFVNTFIPGRTYDIISFAYMGFVVAWYLSVRERVMDKTIRRLFLVGTASIVLLFMLRVCKWNYFGSFRKPNEYLWYLYYVPITLLPLCSLNIALLVGAHDARKTLILTRVLRLVGAGLCVFVVTNSFHNLVFKIQDLDPDHLKYTLGAGYFAIVAFSLSSIIAAFIVLFHRCRLSTSRRLAFIPVLVLVFGIGMIALYYINGGAPKLLGSKLYNLQEAFEFLFIAFWESCIQIGLIPTNSDYGKLFESSGLDAYIADSLDRIVYRTADYGAHENEPDFRVNSQAIRAGKVVWQDDISKINEIRQTLVEVTKELADENELLEMENETSSKKAEMDSLMNLYDELYDSVRPEITSLRKLLSAIEQGGPEELSDTRKATVLGAFIKRRGNLSILAHNAPQISMNELEYALRESMYYVSLTRTRCSVMFNGKGEVPAEELIHKYEVFHAVSMELLDEECSIMVNVSRGKSFCMRIMADRLLEKLSVDRLKEKFGEGLDVSLDQEEGVTYIQC